MAEERPSDENLEEDLALPGEEEAADPGQMRKVASLPKKPRPKSGLVQRQVVVGEEAKRWEQPYKTPGERLRAIERASPLDREEEARERPPHRPLPEGPVGGVVPEAPVPEEKPLWQRRRRGELEGEDAWTGQRISLWWVLAGLGCVAVLGYFVAMVIIDAGRGELLEEPPERDEMKDNIEDVPIAEFVKSSAELLPVIEEVLAEVNKAEGEELAGLVRGGAASLERRKEWRARKAVPARFNAVTLRELHAAAVGETGYLVMTGLTEDYLRAAAYFVQEAGEYKFDWEASEGYSEVLPTEVDGLTDDEPRLMRVVLEPKLFYTPQFPEKEYRCYALHHQNEGEFIWGFAKRDSVVDRSMLKSYFAADLVGAERRAAVRVRKGPGGARWNEVEIVEFLHSDWLTP